MAPLKNGLSLRENTICCFPCVRLMDSISEKWKFIIKKNEITGNLITYDHHLIKGSGVIT